MTKCVNFVCLNQASTLKRTKGFFCRECLKSNKPMVFECVICGTTFTKERSANLPKYCSAKCKCRAKYLNNKARKGAMFKLEAKIKSKRQTYQRKLKKSLPSPQTLVVTQI